MHDKTFIDSNIFLYAFCNKDVEKQETAKGIVLAGGMISTQVINEVSVNMLRKLQLSEDDIISFIKSCFNRYTVTKLSNEIFKVASSIRKKCALSYYDSIIVAAAVENNCVTLYSEDMQHGQTIGQLKIINPFL